MNILRCETLVTKVVVIFNSDFKELNATLVGHGSYANQGHFFGIEEVFPSFDSSPQGGADVSIFFHDLHLFKHIEKQLYDAVKQEFPKFRVFRRLGQTAVMLSVLQYQSLLKPTSSLLNGLLSFSHNLL